MRLQINKKTLIILALAIGAGVLAALSAQSYLHDRIKTIEEASKLDMVTRVVAAYNLPEGKVLKAGDLAKLQFPAKFIPSGSVDPNDYEQLYGQVITSNLKAGDIVLWANTMAVHQQPFSAKVKNGRRAVTIPVDTINSVSGMLVPGDLIDLYVSFEYRKRQITAPLLQGVLILATGKQSHQGASGQEGETLFSTVTLDTSPEEAAKLVAARQAGVITAFLRNPEDKQATQKGVRGDIASMLGLAKPVAVKRKPTIIYGDQSNRRLPSIVAGKESETAKDKKGVFDLPEQEDVVSAWIDTLPKTQKTVKNLETTDIQIKE